MEFLEHALLLPDAQNTYGCVPACVGGWVERESTEGGAHNDVNATTLPF